MTNLDENKFKNPNNNEQLDVVDKVELLKEIEALEKWMDELVELYPSVKVKNED